MQKKNLFQWKQKADPISVPMETEGQSDICSYGNKRPIRYEKWNEAIAIWYDGNIVSVKICFRSVQFNFIILIRIVTIRQNVDLINKILSKY